MKIYQGIIFPDVVQGLIDIKVIKSHADLMLKIENLDEPKTEVTGDASRFRVMRRIDKMLKGNGKSVPAKESKKLIRGFIKRFKEDFQSNRKIALSDYRYPGAFYLIIKGYFVGQNFSNNDKGKQALSAYVLTLCDEEKDIFKNYDSLDTNQLIRDKFNISFDSLENEILKLYPDIDPDTPSEAFSEIIQTVVKLHQYLHLFAIGEQDFYLTNGEQASQEELLNREAIKRLLPSVDDGIYVSSVNKLITHLFSSLEFSSQEKFVEHLCGDDIKCPDRIKRKLNRWKSGGSQITPKAINELFQQSYDEVIPDELVIAVSLIDNIARELISMGLSVRWVVNEITNYEYYQKEIIKELGTPYLDTKIVSLNN